MIVNQVEARSEYKKITIRKFDESLVSNDQNEDAHGSAYLRSYGHRLTNQSNNINLRGPIIHYPGFTSIDYSNEMGILRLKKGSRFAAFLLTPVSSKTSKVGDVVCAMVLSTIKLNKQIVIPPGALLKGWISNIYSERSVLNAKLSSTRWRKSHGALAIHFNELHRSGQRILQIKAAPAKGTPVLSVSAEFALKVNESSEIELDFSGAKYGAAGVAIQAASWASGPFKLVVGPVLSGTAGAIAPAYALDGPVKDPDSRRIEGLLNGIVKGLPGGGIALGAKHKGIGIELAKGTELQIELKQDLVVLDRLDFDIEETKLMY